MVLPLSYVSWRRTCEHDSVDCGVPFQNSRRFVQPIYYSMLHTDCRVGYDCPFQLPSLRLVKILLPRKRKKTTRANIAKCSHSGLYTSWPSSSLSTLVWRLLLEVSRAEHGCLSSRLIILSSQAGSLHTLSTFVVEAPHPDTSRLVSSAVRPRIPKIKQPVEIICRVDTGPRRAPVG